MNELLISAIVPNYNHAKHLPRSIGSLLNQSVLPHEIIVVDDASTDNSLEVLESFSRQHPIVRVHRHETNLGVNASLNRGLSLAQGNYVLFPAADDEVRPSLFENAIRMFRQHPQAGVFCGRCEWRCTATGLTWLKGGDMPDTPGYLSPADLVSLGQRGKLMIAGQHAVYKKSGLIEAGGWLPELKWFSDWFGGYVVAFRHGLCYVPEVLSNFYLYPNSYFNAKAGVHPDRRVVMERLLQLLESAPFADVAPKIGGSGLLGEYGWQMVRVAACRRKHWWLFSPAFARQAARRSAEVIGRRFFPDWLAQWCLNRFYRNSRK